MSFLTCDDCFKFIDCILLTDINYILNYKLDLMKHGSGPQKVNCYSLVSLGSLQAKGSNKSISEPSDDSDATESKRMYTLDREKALDKKPQNCYVEHIAFEMKPGKNFVIRLSTSAYDLSKNEIKKYYTIP